MEHLIKDPPSVHILTDRGLAGAIKCYVRDQFLHFNEESVADAFVRFALNLSSSDGSDRSWSIFLLSEGFGLPIAWHIAMCRINLLICAALLHGGPKYTLRYLVPEPCHLGFSARRVPRFLAYLA
jgi:hypothetical protein